MDERAKARLAEARDALRQGRRDRARESEARPEEDLLDQTFLCQHCGAEVFVSLANCLSCGNAIHSCVNCARRAETECKRQQGIWGPAAEKGRNRCPWWTPAGTGA